MHAVAFSKSDPTDSHLRPVPSDELQRNRDHLIHSLHNRALADEAHIWTAGRGAMLIDDQGREFLDALAGLWNVIVGHGRRNWAARPPSK